MGSQCIVCGGRDFYSHNELLSSCKGCGLVFATHIPTERELERLYQQEYFFGKEYSDYKADRRALEYNFKKRLRHLSPFLNDSAHLVEVGCAYGYFLNLVKDSVAWHKGYDVSLDGVDFANRELGVRASNQNFLAAKIKSNSIDVVCMWDVVEHLGSPSEFIGKASAILKPGGHLALTTGDISALLPRLRGDKWRMIHPPTHLFYFSPKTMDSLLKRHGLEIVSIKHPPIYRNIGSVVNQLRYNRLAKGSSAGLLDFVERNLRASGIGRLNFPLNTFDIMEVIAVKK